MTVQEAYTRGLIRDGAPVLTNGDNGGITSQRIAGIIAHSTQALKYGGFTIKCDASSDYPGKMWNINNDNSNAYIEFLDQTDTMSIRDFYSNMKATPEEKLLKQYNIENPIGTPTAEGLELAALLNYNAQRAEIIKIVTAKEEEEKAAKK